MNRIIFPKAMRRSCSCASTMRWVPILVAGMLPLISEGQPGGSLTEEFARLSPKERARVARQEQADALADTAYQAIMSRGEDLFAAGRYEDALTTYEQAREKRPLNVYPKVKIEDVQVLIRKKKEAAQGPEQTIAPSTVIERSPSPPMSIGTTSEGKPAPSPERAPTTQAPTSQDPLPVRERIPVEEKARTVAHRPMPGEERPSEVKAAVPTEAPPDGITENRYTQGTAEVTELFVTEGGRTTVFKRVVHKWGQVYFFEDGQAIDGRVWRQKFGERP